MKKIILIFLCFTSLIFSACKEKEKIETSFVIPENATLPEETVVKNNSSEEEAVKQNEATSVKASIPEKVDYDLSEMNSNMVYAEVFNMMIEPEIYCNKIIKMRGNFAVYENGPLGEKAYAVIISDALACCQQGIEFKYTFADGEPKPGDIVTVVGTYVTTLLPGDLVYNYVIADTVVM